MNTFSVICFQQCVGICAYTNTTGWMGEWEGILPLRKPVHIVNLMLRFIPSTCVYIRIQTKTVQSMKVIRNSNGGGTALTREHLHSSNTI